MCIKNTVDLSYRAKKLFQQGRVSNLDVELQNGHLVIASERVGARDTEVMVGYDRYNVGEEVISVKCSYLDAGAELTRECCVPINFDLAGAR